MSPTLPAPTHSCWLRLASNQAPAFQTRQLGLQLLFKRLQHEPLTPAGKALAVHTFFVKYEKILGAEISQLTSL